MKLEVAITFFYVEARLSYLKTVATSLALLSDNIHVSIITNDLDNHHTIRQACARLGNNVSIYVPFLLGHPYLLTWCHFEVFRRKFKLYPDITHFWYLEDDILVTPENLAYWLDGREKLKNTPFIPSFVRYEYQTGKAEKFVTDTVAPVDLNASPSVEVAENYQFINLPTPDQGMYLLDRALAKKHFFGGSSSPDFGRWGIREKAAQGITYLEVPKGFYSRNLVGVIKQQYQLDPRCLIHHLPNNYANHPKSKFAKVAVDALFF
ncbi:hypothetical protein L1F28_24940 [Arthrospira platensis NCB002]|jgi:hypothetical protein|uniref:Uncharacterized protein n=1 Tax=Limnospira platensis NIES-46 TaxID=1236695 RepID=A0A5M3TB01_LIMPL|nr:hypothetical protein [Arthrospira platensis]MDF2211192.1 hypothetical protein [Arthrospira platensis NCB002]BDT11165.1 hypothetical protein N39L_08880 [Arthrospira platensis NIES-39]MDF2211911.1 hypothetical protein [Arthrospira platensis NCB002]BDT14852.1 hypothetical protein N39L_45750 [Arthrospira platensis NIES-39]GCE96684.1 hypothetical protein NIES46_47560 [Arthrospira platensis NIES-46]